MKTLELVSINGLCHIVDVPQNRAAKWIEDFNFYIPETKRNFSLKSEKTTDDLPQPLDRENYKENILTVMHTIGKTVANVSDQRESIKALQEQQSEQKKRIKTTEKQTQIIYDLKQKIETLGQETLTPAKEYEMKKKSFAKLFEN